MIERKIEGYWYSKHEPNYPMPIPNQLTDQEALEISNLIEIKENESKTELYRGMSTSRITNEFLGNAEFKHPSGWIWPGDFRTHYVLKHKVKPTNEFLSFIGYK